MNSTDELQAARDYGHADGYSEGMGWEHGDALYQEAYEALGGDEELMAEYSEGVADGMQDV